MTTAPAQERPFPSPADLPTEEKTLNRELSWLEFNRRVLSLAQDRRTPLLERVKFLSIFSSNLDEFIMKRVGGLRRQVEAGVTARSPDGLTPSETLEAVRRVVVDLQSDQARCFEDEIRPALAEHGVELIDVADLTEEELERLKQWWRVSVFPVLTPLAVDPGHRFPFISNLSTSLGVMLKSPDQGEPLFARVKVPSALPQWIRTDEPGAPLQHAYQGQRFRLISLKNVIRSNLEDLFPGMRIIEEMPFRVTRNADVERDEEGADDLLESIEQEMKVRRFARVVRLEVWPDAPQRLLNFVMNEIDLDPVDVHEREGPMEYRSLFEVASMDIPELQAPRWTPIVPPGLADQDADIFSIIRGGDILVHNPYESFEASVERFIRAAARDPKVLAIKQTLYRTSGDSPFVNELMRAAESGKQVACLVELRARFDEMANVQWAQMLEKAGVHVAYGVVGLKTHCKTALVVRQEHDAPGGIRSYAHIGTGNYNSKTAQQYTDLNLLTCDPAMTADVVELFNYLTGRSRKREYDKLLVAPVSMRRRFTEMIDREIEIAQRGGRGRIVTKTNSFDDLQIADKLYEASQAGVQIDMLVRGFCCLRPGAPGLSENIRVTSIVGRFLEHARIFHFGAGADDPVDGEWYIGSADWMYRNLNNRVEAVAPIEAAPLRRRVHAVIDAMLRDHRCAWDARPDGSYVRRHSPEHADPESPEALGTFQWLMRRTAEQQRAEIGGA